MKKMYTDFFKTVKFLKIQHMKLFNYLKILLFYQHMLNNMKCFMMPVLLLLHRNHTPKILGF